jgi:very-short-patch-repair endonuclease
MLGPYRQDKRAVGALARPDVTVGEAITHLDSVVAWQRAAHEFRTAERELAPWLGTRWHGIATDFGTVFEALRTAHEMAGAVPSHALPAFVDYVCRRGPDETLIGLATEARDDLAAWQTTLRAASEATAPRELALGGIRQAVAWLRAHQEPLLATAAEIQRYADVIGRDLDYTTAQHLGQLRRLAAEADTTLAAAGPRFTLLLGTAYKGSDTNEAALATAIDWTARARRLATGADLALSPQQATALVNCRHTEALAGRLEAWRAARDRVVASFAPQRHAELLEDLHDYGRAQELLNDLRNDSAGQEEWFSHLAARAVLGEYDLDAVVDFCGNMRITADQARPLIEATLFRTWADDVIRLDEALQPVRAEDRHHLIQEYQQLDQELITSAVSEIITSVNARRPSATAVGEPGLIRREGLRKRGHKPVRDLISQARNAVLALKPCFMMSPLAVSQYLPPDLQFDVVIFDEASQVTPGDAVNCIYRGRALITAGDDKQLPPTSFFERVVEEDEQEDADPDVRDYQSILELSKACGAFQNLSLRWHYRSRHEALIAFSNHAFYGGRLVTFPSANAESPDLGVELIRVDGVYRRGAGRDNPLEATAVAKRVVHHFTTRPGQSLGVVAFSVAQADAIEEAVDRALVERPDLEQFRDDDRLTGFFVKNLEAVQGDERDVIIFSIGYGFDEFGKITVNFGALNRPKGWRRLNVAITRARQRVEVVSSIRAADIPETRNESVRHLIDYLDYAERGMPALALRYTDDHRDTESPFEDSVLDTIKSWGHRVTPQVGAAGYRIDLGVRHPGYAGEVYAIGVECDGAMYHSSPSARDRDRLREQVLVGLGWNLHRIWGTAWYRNRHQEEERLRTAIEAAIAGEVDGRLGRPAPLRPTVILETIEPVEVPDWVRPYRRAILDPLPPWVTVNDHNMVPSIERLASIEGPVHIAVVHQRMRDAWQIGRIGIQIRATIEYAIRQAHVDWDGAFLSTPGDPVCGVRGPGDDVTRSVDQIADEELALALTLLVRDGGTVTEPDLKTAAARVFGWARRGRDIDSRLDRVIERLAAEGRLDRVPSGCRINGNASSA